MSGASAGAGVRLATRLVFLAVGFCMARRAPLVPFVKARLVLFSQPQSLT